MEGHDIKEILESIEAAKVMLVAFAKIAKDGKIDLKDSLIIIDLFKQASVLIEGIKGINKIPDEISDLQREEAFEIGRKIYEMLGAIQKA